MTSATTTRAALALGLIAGLGLAGCAVQPPKEAPKEEVKETPPPPKEEVKEAPKPDLPVLHLDNVYFETGKAELRPQAIELLKIAADDLLKDPTKRIEIAGHCDERGSDDYNLDLGWKRAYAVRDFLVRQGIAEDRLFPVSYGRARPAVQGTGEKVWQKNRRGEMEVRP